MRIRKKLSSQAEYDGITSNQQHLCISQRGEHRAAQQPTPASHAQPRRIVFLGSQCARLLESRASYQLVYSETPKLLCSVALLSSAATKAQALCWRRAQPHAIRSARAERASTLSGAQECLAEDLASMSTLATRRRWGPGTMFPASFESPFKQAGISFLTNKLRNFFWSPCGIPTSTDRR